MEDKALSTDVKEEAQQAIDVLAEANLGNGMNTMQSLALGWKFANRLCKSDIVPVKYQNKPENCLVALELSQRTGMSPIMVMQNLDVIQGKPSWASKFVIAIINASKKYKGSLKFNITGEKENLSCYCFAITHDGEEIKGPTITMEMAKAEGWLTKNGSKWKTMPELMI